MMVTSRVDVRQFLVIVVLVIALYWLLMPGSKKVEEKPREKIGEIDIQTNSNEETSKAKAIEIENMQREKDKVRQDKAPVFVWFALVVLFSFSLEIYIKDVDIKKRITQRKSWKRTEVQMELTAVL